MNLKLVDALHGRAGWSVCVRRHNSCHVKHVLLFVTSVEDINCLSDPRNLIGAEVMGIKLGLTIFCSLSQNDMSTSFNVFWRQPVATLTEDEFVKRPCSLTT